ncbi:hypothetical protein V8C34DRAFT_319974 [Trichoderma compactum]
MASSYTNCTPGRKLKDSCDPCSASKLRCNKQKPTCARCVALNQQCSYSPARRAGRPHRVREKGQHQCSEIAAEPIITSLENSNQSIDMSLDTSTLLVMHSERHNPKKNEQHQQQQPAGSLSRQVSVPIHDTREDCTRVAISILEQLDFARRRPGLTNVNLATTDACQRLLTILVCPCSEKPGVALLVACGCISLMDTVHHCHAFQTTTIPDLSASTTTTSTEKDISNWPRPSSSHNSQGGVEQLAKIARLILQFTDRYSQEPKGGTGWAQTTWLVAPIAALLRFRLQSVTHQAARRLVF